MEHYIMQQSRDLKYSYNTHSFNIKNSIYNKSAY